MECQVGSPFLTVPSSRPGQVVKKAGVSLSFYMSSDDSTFTVSEIIHGQNLHF